MSREPIILRVERQQLDDRLAKLAAQSSDMQPAFEEIGQIVLSSIEKNFMVEGRYNDPESAIGGDKKWKPLSERTLYNKIGGRKGFTKKGDRLRESARRRIAENKILQDSGQLAASISSSADRTGVEVGTNKVYAAIHQFGGAAGRNRKVTIPARPFILMQEEDIDEAIIVLDRHLLRGQPQ